MRTEGHTFFGDFAQFVQTENLESAGIGQNGSRPRHEPMQTAQLADLLDPRPKVEVIGVPEKDLDAEFFENVLRNALDRSQSAHRHKDRGFDLAMGGAEPPGASWA